ncbi:MAG: cytochrome C oxidase subunit IV family protein [Acidobacteria bacterium]|nr:cytochrome C oxidase subunit IV family protein [Acidobacteriota bacterium]
MSEKIVPKRVYFTIFGLLIGFTLLTVWVASRDWGAFNTIIALTIAVTKALLVALWFMHIKYSNRLTQLVVASGLFWLVIMVALTLFDYRTRSMGR